MKAKLMVVAEVLVLAAICGGIFLVWHVGQPHQLYRQSIKLLKAASPTPKPSSTPIVQPKTSGSQNIR